MEQIQKLNIFAENEIEKNREFFVVFFVEFFLVSPNNANVQNEKAIDGKHKF